MNNIEFQQYLKFVSFQAQRDMEAIRRNLFIKDSDYDRSADAFFIVSKDEGFELTLTPSEYRVIRHYHYHNPIDTKASLLK